MLHSVCLFFIQKRLWLAMALLLSLNVQPVRSETPVANTAASGKEASDVKKAEDGAFFEAVQLYRKGDYPAAKRRFGDLSRQAPEDVRVSYYLAMTEAQQGNFKQAERWYRMVIDREPDGKLAQLAREGLKYLPPADAVLDRPPRFPSENANESSSPSPSGLSPSTTSPSAALSSPASSPTPGGNAVATPGGGLSPQDLMMLQMMMSGSGNGNNGGMNWGMMPMLMQPSANGSPAIDPEVMKTILMNQMMQGFDLNSKDNN